MKKFIYILAFAHLTFVALTIFHVLDRVCQRNKIVDKTFAFICSINYSVWRFGFFSPDVGKSNEVEIKLYNINGDSTTLSTCNGFNFNLANADLGKRFYGFKVFSVRDTLIQDLCARSVATRMMNLYPGTYKVSYTLRSIHYPTMSGYCKNDPINIKQLYTTDFILSR